MKTRKSPQLKKRDEYDKTFRTRMENPHAFRKNWPKKKARANRAGRVAVRNAWASMDLDQMTDQLLRRMLNQRTFNKSDVMPLREFLHAVRNGDSQRNKYCCSSKGN